MVQTAKSANRPLSPHLQIYRWQLTMALSILHRMTGAALAAGLAVIVWMLMAAAMGPEAWARFSSVAQSCVGQLALFGWSAALYFHAFNGIRHLVWDTGHLFKIRSAYLGGYAVLLATVVATAATWWAFLT